MQSTDIKAGLKEKGCIRISPSHLLASPLNGSFSSKLGKVYGLKQESKIDGYYPTLLRFNTCGPTGANKVAQRVVNKFTFTKLKKITLLFLFSAFLLLYNKAHSENK